MPDVQQMIKRQQVLADFGEFTLRHENLDEVLTEACRLVADALGTGRAKVLEIREDGRSLLLRAGVGWAPEIVGRVRLPMNERSSETFAIKEGVPIISQDINKEERFVVPEFMRTAGVVALANVPIRVPGGKAYGLLQVDAPEPRDFGNEDIEFLRTYATILGPVIDRLQKLNTLRSTEERFRLVVENARDYAIFTCDPEDRIVDWYPGAETVFGWSAEEAVGKPAAIIFTPEDREAGEDATETEMAAREGSAPNVRWHQRKDGSRVFIEGMTTSLRAADGSLIGFLKIGQDVTERRLAEERLRNALGIKTVGIIFWGPDFRLTEVNDAFLEMTGFSRQEALGRTWQELTPEGFHPASLQAIEQVTTLGEAVPYEKEYFRKDGSNWWGLFAARKVGDEVVEFVLDVTDRKRAEAALRESEELRRIALESGGMGAWRWDTRERSIRADDVVQRLWGISTSDQPHPVSMYADLMPAEGVAWLDAVMAKEIGPDEGFQDQVQVASGPNAGRWVQLRGRAERDRPWIINGVTFNITAEKEAAKRQEVLVNELQHRARNLLGVVSAVATQTLKQGGSVKAFEERLQALSRVQGLLSQGGSDTVEVGVLVRAELAAYVEAARESVTISGPKVLLVAHQVQNFALAVHELTTNAVKYGALKAKAGRLDVTWEVMLDQRGRRRLALSWIESGLVVEPEKIERRGYGSELIREGLAYALGAEVDYVLGADGVRCRIEMPVG